MFNNLTEDNFLLYCAKVYDRPNAVMSEFNEDLDRILYIKRLLTKYYSSGCLKERLIMNHLIVLYNCFGVDATTRLIFFRLEERDYSVMKPFLIFLNYMPDVIHGINGKDIISSDIELDKEAVRLLREIK
jgi:hypothetical protein